jgi:hypothetical protein
MALQGLRGSGFNPVSGAPFMQLRENRENKALAIMEKSQAREDKKKEREKEEKAADQVLKKEFDQAKQEAVILGLPVGRATSMSLGSLKGWLSASRELKVNNEKMERLLLEKEKAKREEEDFNNKKAQRVAHDKGAEIAMRNPLGSGKKMPNMPLSQMIGYNNARAEQQKGAPPTMNQTTMSNGQTATQTYGGGQPLQTQMPPQMPTPFKPDGQKTAGYVSGTGSYHPIAGASSRPMSHNPANDLIDPSTGDVIKKGSSSGGMSKGEYEQIKSSFNRIAKELEAGPPDGLRTSEREQWISSRRTLVNEFGDLMNRAKVNGGNDPTANTAAPQAQQQDPKAMFEQYFTDGQPNQNYIETITSGAGSAKEAKKNKIDLIRSLLSSGAINEETAKELLKNAPYPAN